MAQIGNVPEIILVKKHLEEMKRNGVIKEWELPYENLLTRLSAAIFFVTPVDDLKLSDVVEELSRYENFRWRKNTEKKLSNMEYRIEFNCL